MTPDEDTLPVQEPVETNTENPEYDYGSEQQVDFTNVELILSKHYHDLVNFSMYTGIA